MQLVRLTAAYPRAFHVENGTILLYLKYEFWNKLERFEYKAFIHTCLSKYTQTPSILPF